MPSDLDGVQVHFVEDTAGCVEFLNWLSQRRPILAIDTETTGLRWWTPSFTRLVQFGDGQQGYALDALRWRGTIQEALYSLKQDGSPVAFHNLPFDRHALSSDGFGFPDPRRCHDTKVMSHLTNNLGPHGLKPLSDKYWPGASAGQALLKQTMAKNKWDWATVPVDHPHYWSYGVLDTVLTARLAEKLYPLTPPEAYEREMHTQHVLYQAEVRGLRIDTAHTADLLFDYANEAEMLLKELQGLGIKNPSSNRQVQAALEDAGWEPEEFTETGAARLDKVILSDLSSSLGITADVAVRVLRYKRLLKWSSAYLTTFLSERDSTDHVHASINTLAARTGRMSVTNPALQTLPRNSEIKSCILPEEGHALLEVDWQAQEARIFAHYSQDPGLLDIFLRGEDVHTGTASAVYGVPADAVTPEQRQIAKNVTFAKLYGAGADKIASTAGVPVSEVKGFLDGYDRAFPGVPRFMDEVDRAVRGRYTAERRAYVTTSGGRQLCCDPDKLYTAVNYLIQGSGADVIKQTICDLDAAGLADCILLPVHDSLLFSVPTDSFDETCEEIIQIMTRPFGSLTLTVDASGPLSSWGAK